MPKIEAVLFDLDGVVRDSPKAVIPAVSGALEHHGIHVPLDRLRPHLHSIRAVHVGLELGIDYASLEREYDLLMAGLRGSVGLNEGVRDSVTQIRAEGRLTGIVSSSRYAEKYIDELDAADLFDVVVNGLMVRRRLKPDPKPVELALSLLEVEAGKAVMVDDLPAGIIAGKQAGTFTVGATFGIGTEDMLRDVRPDYFIHSFPEILPILDTIEAL